MFKELIKERDKEYKKWRKALAKADPYYKAFDKAKKSLKDKFIEEKLYIPIEKLKDYLGNRDAESFTIVYENGETEHLSHSYGIDYENTKWSKGEYVPANMIVSSVDDTGYSFSHDIDEEHIVGFYDLTLNHWEHVKVKETFMEEIIKNLD